MPDGVKALKLMAVCWLPSQVVGFQKVRLHTNEPLGMGVLDLPPYELSTTGY
jgi:hypothetical protein